MMAKLWAALTAGRTQWAKKNLVPWYHLEFSPLPHHRATALLIQPVAPFIS